MTGNAAATVIVCKTAMAALVAALICGLAIPALIRLAPRLGLMDIPDNRKIHTGPMPVVGGLGMAIGLAAVLALFPPPSPFLLYYLAANGLILTLGLYDDIRHAGPMAKLAVQTTAAVLFAWGTGLRFTFSAAYPQFLNEPVISFFITCFWIVGITNAINLIDGMDGLAGGLSFFSFGALTLVGMTKGAATYSLLASGFMGITGAFLLFNMPKAKTFMGDTGSLFLGFNIGIISIAVSMKTGATLAVVLPIMFVGIPVLDTFLAIFRRLRNNRNPLSHPDRQHIHHKLLDLNFSSKQALVIFYLISFLLSALAISSLHTGILVTIIVVLCLMYGFTVLIYFLQRQRFDRHIQAMNLFLENVEHRIRAIAPANRKLDRLAVRFMMKTTIIFLVLSFFPSGHYSLTRAVISSLVVALYLVSLIASDIRDNGNFILGFSYFWLYLLIFYQLMASPVYDIMLIVLFLLAIPLLAYAIFVKRYVNIFFPEPVEPMIAFVLYLIYQSGCLDNGKLTGAIGATAIAYLLHKGIYKNDISVTREFQLTHVIIALMIPIFLFTGYRQTHSMPENSETHRTAGTHTHAPEIQLLPESLAECLKQEVCNPSTIWKSLDPKAERSAPHLP